MAVFGADADAVAAISKAIVDMHTAHAHAHAREPRPAPAPAPVGAAGQYKRRGAS